MGWRWSKALTPLGHVGRRKTNISDTHVELGTPKVPNEKSGSTVADLADQMDRTEQERI